MTMVVTIAALPQERATGTRSVGWVIGFVGVLVLSRALDGDKWVAEERLRVLTDAELDDPYVARAGLEGWAAYLAAVRVAAGQVPPVHLGALDAMAITADVRTTAGDLVGAAQADHAFHEAVAVLVQRPMISVTLHRWWDQITVSTRRSLLAPQRPAQVHLEHEGICHALRAGEAAGVRAGVEAHVLATRGALAGHETSRS